MAETSQHGTGPEVVGLGDGRAEDVISALSSSNTRRIYEVLREEPATTSEVADRLDLSLQNVHHHLKKLKAVDLVEVNDTRFSEKRNEMKVYAAAEAPVIIFPGSREDATELRSLLKRFLGAIGVLGFASVLLHGLAGLSFRSEDQVRSFESGPVPGPTGAPEAAPAAGDGLLPALDAVSPGVWLFAGGALVLSTLLFIRYFDLKKKSE